MGTRVRVSYPVLVRRRWLNRGGVGVKMVENSDYGIDCKRHRDMYQLVVQSKQRLVFH